MPFLHVAPVEIEEEGKAHLPEDTPALDAVSAILRSALNLVPPHIRTKHEKDVEKWAAEIKAEHVAPSMMSLRGC